jgi:hypothetical protein
MARHPAYGHDAIAVWAKVGGWHGRAGAFYLHQSLKKLHIIHLTVN